jgi:hypothetical protein
MIYGTIIDTDAQSETNDPRDRVWVMAALSAI